MKNLLTIVVLLAGCAKATPVQDACPLPPLQDTQTLSADATPVAADVTPVDVPLAASATGG